MEQSEAKRVLESRIIPKRVILENGCWENSIRDNGKGYKSIKIKVGKFIYIHRLSYIAFYGNIPEGLSVLHDCDNPGCFNPQHLFSGTQQDNMDDMDRKGRRGVWHPFGDKNPSKKPEAREKLSEKARERKRNPGGTFAKN